jgi:hypothetical protein
MPLPSKPNPPALRSTKKDDVTFSEVVRLIAASREKVAQSVNTALIESLLGARRDNQPQDRSC